MENNHSKKLKYSDKIKQYLNNKGDKLHFESELKKNKELKIEFEATIAAQNSLDYIAFNQLKDELKRIKQNKPAKIISIQKRIISVAAVFFIIVSASILWFANSKYSNTYLASTGFIEPNFSTVRGKSTSNILTKGINAYYENDYNNCQKLLSSIDKNSPLYIDAQYILGLSLLKNNLYTEAIASFNKVYNSGDKKYKSGVKWNLMIAYLKNDETNKALAILDEFLQNPTSNYYHKAKQLKTKLQSNWRKLVF